MKLETLKKYKHAIRESNPIRPHRQRPLDQNPRIPVRDWVVNVKRALQLMLSVPSMRQFQGSWKGEPACVIGNGVSRRGFDLQLFVGSGVHTIGCNAIYRDGYHPELLCVIDKRMVASMREENGLGTSRFLSAYGLVEQKHQLWMSKNASALLGIFTGGTSMATAIISGASPIFILGCDTTPRQRIYQGQRNYRNTVPKDRRMKTWRECFYQCFDHGKFVEVENEVFRHPNVDHLTRNEFVCWLENRRDRLSKVEVRVLPDTQDGDHIHRDLASTSPGGGDL